MYLIARAVHHRIDDAQVGYELVTTLLVADIIVATHELQINTHLAERVLVIIHRSGNRVNIVGDTEMLAGASDNLRCLAIPAE